MSTSTQKTLSEKQYSGQQVLKRSPIPALITAALFRGLSHETVLRHYAGVHHCDWSDAANPPRPERRCSTASTSRPLRAPKPGP